jgi:ribonuclease E
MRLAIFAIGGERRIREPQMAEETKAAATAAKAPTSADIERAREFAREPFLLEGEKPKDLAAGTPRRRALDAALAEIDEGREAPSIEWRRDFSLLLGLERLLSEDEPRLADGAELSAHQVDALSGTLAALIADVQERINGHPWTGNGNGRAAATATVEEVEEEEEAEPENGAANGDADLEEEEAEEGEEEATEAEEAEDWIEEEDEDVVEEAPDDPGADRRFWFEHATGSGKTVAAVGFIEASRTGGILILTHRRNLVDQFIGEISDRGYADRLSPALLDGADHPYGPVTVETYQWFVRNAGRISDAYCVVICDEAHTALGEKTSACIRAWPGPVFIGMTATGALIARHVTDLFPTQTSRFDLAQAARRGVIAPLRCVRIPPGPGVRTIAKVPLRKGEVDQDFDQEELAKLLDQTPFNVAIADLYRSRFRRVPGVVYTAGVKHANNVAKAFQEAGINARAVSGETPKRELAEILAGFERGDVDVLCNAMLLAEGWNSPRATICMHLAPTASRRVYQQRVGRVTRRNPGKEAGLVIDFVHPATTHDETIVTLHSLLDRDVYRGGAIVVGPVRRGRGRRVRVEKRVVPVSDDSNRRLRVLERELWRIAVENLNHSEQHVWAALAGARVNPSGWRRAKAMLQHDQSKELRRRFLLTCVQRNRNQQLRIKALSEIAVLRDAEAFDDAIDTIGTWSRDDRRAGTKVMLEALAERRIGRRDQAQAWVWRLADYTRDLHEEYAVQRWPETKRLLGLLVNSSGRAHGRNARRLVHAARNQDRRLAAALLAAGIAHTPEGEEVLRGARMRAARKPSAVARELLRNFPKSGGRRRRRKRKGGSQENGAGEKNGARRANGRRAEDRELEELEETESENGSGREADQPEEIEAAED